jgi:S-(hydroxymethyl)glutathione dehydrogenase/alcohol dehydrogenase
VGSDVRHVAPGDHVIGCLSVFCGTCDYCVSGRPNLCGGEATARPKDGPPRLSKNGEPLGQFAHLGAYAEQMLLHENAIVKIRDDMPLDRAALIGCGVTTGLGAAASRGQSASSPSTPSPGSSTWPASSAPPTASTPAPATPWGRCWR